MSVTGYNTFSEVPRLSANQRLKIALSNERDRRSNLSSVGPGLVSEEIVRPTDIDRDSGIGIKYGCENFWYCGIENILRLSSVLLVRYCL